MKINDNDLDKVIMVLNEIEDLLPYIEKSPFVCTLSAYYNFILKIEALNKDIQQIESGYTLRVLLRVSIEHFIVAYYILYKYMLKNTDSTGEDYYGCYRISESLKRNMYDLGTEGILQGIDKNANLSNLKKKLGAKDIDFKQSDVDEIHTIAGQFGIKKIQSFILKNRLPGNFFHDVNKTVIPDFLSLYNRLSSYIHGGPSAEDEFNNKIIDIAKDKEWNKTLFFLTIVNFFILLTSIDEKFDYLRQHIKIPDYNQ
ncbi:hypothetical protein ABS768_11375 [Flavobacterium sp. ST-75]|uniref:RiboL-PSP-HEPN domain-containing protein n=1 Tax=Flavobacterium rhizophilum TaxID=3163296 RepID=A0ABW8YDJ9_9FLAO